MNSLNAVSFTDNQRLSSRCAARSREERVTHLVVVSVGQEVILCGVLHEAALR